MADLDCTVSWISFVQRLMISALPASRCMADTSTALATTGLLSTTACTQRSIHGVLEPSATCLAQGQVWMEACCIGRAVCSFSGPPCTRLPHNC